MMYTTDLLPTGQYLNACQNVYQIESVLGVGAFGVTYKARAIQEPNQPTVVIKEYFPLEWSFRHEDGLTVCSNHQGERHKCCDDGVFVLFSWGLQRMLDEARTLQRLKHANITRFRHYFFEHQTLYLVLDYMPGESLKTVLEEQCLDERELRDLLAETLDTLAFIHDAGYIHRDIKPSNLLLRKDSRVLFIDFGSARMLGDDFGCGCDRSFTPGYSPPEQYSSNGWPYGPWSDLYALGAVLYRMVTGQQPPDATARMMGNRLIPLRQAIPGRYSEPLLALIDEALALEPQRRFQSADAMHSALEATRVFTLPTKSVSRVAANSNHSLTSVQLSA